MQHQQDEVTVRRATAADIIARNALTFSGRVDGRPMLFAHGFGCDQSMWRFVTPAFADDHRIVLFDHVGAGQSDLDQWNPDRYATLDGYAQDIVEIAQALDLHDAILVTHSVASVMGALAATAAPDRFGTLVMLGPSPAYIDDGDYRGGFSLEDIRGLLDTMDQNYLGWSEQMAPVIMDNPDQPELGEELTNSFCRTDPRIARHFARTTFLSDNRSDLAAVPVPTLVVQVRQDALAPLEVGEYVHANLPDSELVVLDTVGHCPHMSAPGETIAAIREFLVLREASDHH